MTAFTATDVYTAVGAAALFLYFFLKEADGLRKKEEKKN
jgi:hypothetical protein